ncbi:MAG TPA: trigger factor [Polyangiaceae bacterium]|jgi:trigger factor
MQVQVARLSPVMLELAVEVPAPDVKAEVEKAYSTLQRKAHVKGFRPGKAPRQILVRLYGPQVASDVINALVNQTLPKALDEQKVQPINQPQVEAGSFEPATAFSYKARFEVQPEVETVVYEGFQLSRPPTTADEKMVDEQIELLRKQHARLEAPEPARAAQKGDVVTVDFTLDVDGVPMKEAAGEGIQLELGGGQVLPELDEALVGKKLDEAFDVEAKLPDNNPREELRGKPSKFHVKVKDLKQRILPALDDELAKDVGNFQTLVELRADIHTKLQKMLKDASDTSVAEQIVEQLNEKNQLEVPPTLVEQQCRMMEMEILQNARRRGQRPTQEDFQKIHGQVHADSERKVRAGLLMAAIAKKVGFVIGEEEIAKGIEELAAETGKNVAKVRAEYADPQRRQVLMGMILEDKVLDVIESKATIREGHPEPKKGDAAGEAGTKSQEPASKAKKKGKAKEGESEETR